MNQNRAFTLAEVLVTLMIIGVIAAVTIPSLNQNTKDSQYAAGCLKANSVLSQAVDRMKLDYGPIGLGLKWNREEEIWKGFVSQLNAVKVDNSATSECYPASMATKYMDGSKDSGTQGHTVITTDGFCINYNRYKHQSIDFGLSGENKANCLGRFLVDVNGQKGPNVYGRDIFFFLLVKGVGIVPAGIDTNSADCVTKGKGLQCAARVLKEKKIDYK